MVDEVNPIVDDEPAPKVKQTAYQVLNDTEPMGIRVQREWQDVEVYRTAMTVFPFPNDDWRFVSVVWSTDPDIPGGVLNITADPESKYYTGDYRFNLVVGD